MLEEVDLGLLEVILADSAVIMNGLVQLSYCILVLDSFDFQRVVSTRPTTEPLFTSVHKARPFAVV